MNRRNFAFDRTNFILLAVSFAIVLIGFVLMSGGASTEQAFNAEVFSAQRIKVAPVVCFIGFVTMIYAVIRKPKTVDDPMLEEPVNEGGSVEAEVVKTAEKVEI